MAGYVAYFPTLSPPSRQMETGEQGLARFQIATGHLPVWRSSALRMGHWSSLEAVTQDRVPAADIQETSKGPD